MIFFNGKEAVAVIKNGVAQYPNYVRDGLSFHYDNRGKYNTDTYKEELLDLTGNQKTGTLKNFVCSDANSIGHISGVLNVDGINDFVKIPSISSKANFTVQVDNVTVVSTSNKIEVFEGNIKASENLIVNGCGEEGGLGANFASSDWTYSATGYNGQPSFSTKVATASIADYISVDTAKAYTFSFYIKSAPSTKKARIGFQCYDSNYALLATKYIKESIVSEEWEYCEIKISGVGSNLANFASGTVFIKPVFYREDGGLNPLQSARLTICKSEFHVENVLNGKIDRNFRGLRVYSRSLTEAERNQNYEIDKRVGIAL